MSAIYCWTLGELTLARIAKHVYVRGRIAKNEDGIFYDDKVLGITTKEDGSIEVTEELCYYVELCRSQEKLWVPYTCLRLAGRSRPFYGPAEKAPSTDKTIPELDEEDSEIEEDTERRAKDDHTLPLNVTELAEEQSEDQTASLEIRLLPLNQRKDENACKDFTRRGQEMLFDDLLLTKHQDDDLSFLMNLGVTTEDKFEAMIRDEASAEEVKSYLYQCWRYKTLDRDEALEEVEDVINNSDCSRSDCPSPEELPQTVHAYWCLVCGKRDDLTECTQCASSYHMSCRNHWPVYMIHRRNQTTENGEDATVKKVLSSTRKKSIKSLKDTLLCPSCLFGPKVAYGDVVWHKLGRCPWWPARILKPGDLPSCLVSRMHDNDEWPVFFYGTSNFSWCDPARMCLFMPTHTAVLDDDKPEEHKEAVLDACDDYIRVYLA